MITMIIIEKRHDVLEVLYPISFTTDAERLFLLVHLFPKSQFDVSKNLISMSQFVHKKKTKKVA